MNSQDYSMGNLFRHFRRSVPILSVSLRCQRLSVIDRDRPTVNWSDWQGRADERGETFREFQLALSCFCLLLVFATLILVRAVSRC